MSPRDYGQTAYARQNREAKALQLAAVAWDRGLSGDDLLALEPAARRALARDADVNPPKDPGDTWPAVLDLLEKKQAWADDHPDDPRARRGGVPAQAAPPAVESDPGPAVSLHGRLDDAGIPAKDGPTPRPDAGLVMPKGWPELAAAWPPLARPDARCCVCRGPAVTASGHQWRCAAHPPQPGDIGARLNWAPTYPAAGCGRAPERDDPGRCYCTRCPGFVIQMPPRAPQAPSDDRW